MLRVIGSCTFRYAAKARIFHVCNMSAAARQEFLLRETKGDLFECPATDSLAHCVSKDLHMGKGIAVIFKKKFGGVDKLKAQKKDVGDVAVLEHDQRYVYYLITKPRFFNKPTLQTLEKSLQAMKSHCEENNVSSLAMPMIGCGLDKLEWNKVSALIKDVFKDLPMTITVYTIPSKGEQSNPSNCQCTKYPKQEA